MRGFGLTILFISFLSCIVMADSKGVTGKWTGIVTRNQNPSPVVLHIESMNPFAARVSLRLEGIVAQPAVDPVLKGGSLTFSVSTENGPMKFDLTVKDRTMKGTIDGAEAELMALSSVTSSAYFGAYRLTPDYWIYIRTWDEAGADQLVYFDSNGGIAPLYPLSETSFVAGPGLMIPLPAQARFEFTMANGRATGFTLSKNGQEEKRASRVTDITEEEVSFGSAEAKLTGTLIKPAGKPPFPAVVFVHGSGPVTRDFFGPLPYFLAQHGVAVLTYDKRGQGKSTGHWLEADFEELSQDALAGVQLLLQRKDVDPDRTGLLGISQGGWILPLAAAKSQAPKFLVVISAATVTPEQQQLQLVAGEMRAAGASNEDAQKALQQARAQFAELKAPGTGEWVKGEIERLEKEGKFDALNANGMDNPKFLQFYRGILNFDPVPFWEKVRCPVLAIYGDKDTLVPPSENRPRLEEALRKAGNMGLQLQQIPSADHAILFTKSGSMKEFPFHTRFAPEFFPILSAWAQKLAAGK